MRDRSVKTFMLLAAIAANVAIIAIEVPTPGHGATPNGASNTMRSAHAEAAGFRADFAGRPASPEPWAPTDWDIQVHSRQEQTWNDPEPMEAHHGADCSAPPATHRISSSEAAVFVCNDHLMTAINSVTVGYAAIYLTPNQLVDFSSGEAVIRWDMSTFRSSARDWIDLWITPYDDNLARPLQDGLPDLNGPPRNALHLLMDCGFGCPRTYFRGLVYRDFRQSELKGLPTAYEDFLVPNAVRRDTFELRISRTHVKLGMPNYDRWWLDTSIADLGWSAGVVQFGHHSYTPEKDCGHSSYNGCPNTWHWDNVSVSPGRAFTIMRADRRVVSRDAAQEVTFAAPAPPNAHLRYAAVGSDLEVSMDGGSTWQPAQLQAQSPKGQGNAQDDIFKSYWQPVAEGTTGVLFRGRSEGKRTWMVQDVTIWAPAE